MKQKFKIEVLARDIETPWGMAFLPDGRILMTERGGHIRIYNKGKVSDAVKNTPVPHVQQDGGYFDITVHPQYARNGWIYLAYSEVKPGFTPPAPDATPAPAPAPAPAAGAAPGGAGPGGGGGGGGGRGRGPQIPANTVIVRGKINAQNEWTNNEVLFRSPEGLYATTAVHFGCRFLWDRQGHLFFTLGERGNMKNVQTLTDKNSLGRIHRINDDGTAPWATTHSLNTVPAPTPASGAWTSRSGRPRVEPG